MSLEESMKVGKVSTHSSLTEILELGGQQALVGRLPLHESYWLVPLLVVLKLANCVKIDHEI